MSSYDEYMASLKILPGDLVQVLHDGRYLPVRIDFSPGAERRPGTYLCLNCGHDPYDPVYDPFSTGCQCCNLRRDRHVDPSTTASARDSVKRMADRERKRLRRTWTEPGS